MLTHLKTNFFLNFHNFLLLVIPQLLFHSFFSLSFTHSPRWIFFFSSEIFSIFFAFYAQNYRVFHFHSILNGLCGLKFITIWGFWSSCNAHFRKISTNNFFHNAKPSDRDENFFFSGRVKKLLKNFLHRQSTRRSEMAIVSVCAWSERVVVKFDGFAGCTNVAYLQCSVLSKRRASCRWGFFLVLNSLIYQFIS